MKFKYKKYAPHILRPVIPVKIVYKDKVLVHEALVDSGADVCIFDAQIADILDINLADGEPSEVSGITGVSENYYLHPVTIIVGGRSFNVKVGFLLNIARLGYGVLGQRGFFDKFVVKFDLVKEFIELKEKT